MNRQRHIMGYIVDTTQTVRARKVNLHTRKHNTMPYGTDWIWEDEP